MRRFLVGTAALVFAVSAFSQQAPVNPEKSAAIAPSTDNAPPEHPVTPAQVHEIMILTNANQLATQMMRGMMVNLKKTFPPYLPQDVIADLESSLEHIDFEPMMLESYQKHMSTEDAADIIAFYKTPAGRRFIAVMPDISSDMQKSGAQWGTQIVEEVVLRHSDEIKDAAAKYRLEHLDAPAISSPN